ncbi:MAG: LppX_LprAFG lipoprotein [Actinobacteria bacterium]|nr:LppX_LprAFG lipoprotein [Actinomycetota bacterium]
MTGGKRWIGVGIAVVVVAIVVVIVAQGGGGGSSPLNAIAKAAEVTQREPGGRATLVAKVTVSNSPEGILESGTMEFEDNERARGTLKVKGLSNGKELEVESIVDGTTSYSNSDAFEPIADGKKWVKLDFSGAAKLQGGATPTPGNPQEGLKVLENVQDAEVVGKEQIDGVPTTHYRGTFPATEEVFGVKSHFSAPRADVWIDSQGRVRRLRIVVAGSLNEGERTTTIAMDINFVEFGRVPKIELPPADEAFDATGELESGIQSAAAGH